MKDFIVIDTEGRDLTEIAIIDSDGKKIYDIAVRGSLNLHIQKKESSEIIDDFLKIAKDKIVIAHYAKHDKKILRKFFASHNRLNEFQKITFECTVELSYQTIPNLKSYSLEYLSRFLNLKVDKNYFNTELAHRADYDAKFTYKLYKKIKETQMINKLKSDKKLINPFSSNRVDTPFQKYPDIQNIYKNEFEILINTLDEIKEDKNNQSKGVVIIGEAGSGKTHLIMRLAKERLENNRLFFIRQPNNEKTVMYHIYNRMLESFFEKLENNYTQLEVMLGKTFSNIVIESIEEKNSISKKDELILKNLKESSLNIYKKFGRDGTISKRNNWKLLEKKALLWWEEKYGFGGFSSEILRGLIRFCTYSDQNRRDVIKKWLIASHCDDESVQSVGLTNWDENLNKEDFAIEAITTFGKLSLVDEPLIFVFDQLEGLKNRNDISTSFGESVKEVFTQVPNSLVIINLFPQMWNYFQTIYDSSVTDRMGQKRVFLELPSPDELKILLDLRLKNINSKSDDFFTKEELLHIVDSTSMRDSLTKASNFFSSKIYGIKTNIQKKDTQKEMEIRLKRIEQKLDKILMSLKVESKDVLQPLTEILSDEVDDNLETYIKENFNFLYNNHYQKAIFTESDDIGKLHKFIDSFARVFQKEYKKDYLRFGKKVLPENILLEKNGKKTVIAFLYAGGNSFTSRIKNLNHSILEHKDTTFYLIRDSRSEILKSKIAKVEIGKFQQQENTKYYEIGKEKRVIFDLLDKLIDDIENQNINTELEKAIKGYCTRYKDFWLIDVIK